VVPRARPNTAKLRAHAGRLATVDQVRPFVDRWIRYPVTTAPPLVAGGVHETVTRRFPAVARTPRGAPGTVRGVARTTADGPPPPAEFTATTRNLYDVPFARPNTAKLRPDAGRLATVDQVTPFVDRWMR